MKRVLIFAAVLLAVGLHASVASATTAAVTYSQTCERGTVTVTSSWDGVTHIHVVGPSPEIAFDVPGRQSASANFAIRPSPLTVTVSSSNGHLTGELTHTFTTNGCATTTSVPTTAPGIVPGPTEVPTSNPPSPSTPAPGSGPAPTSTPAVTTVAGAAPTTPPGTTPSKPVATTSKPGIHLPATCLRAEHCQSIPEPHNSDLGVGVACLVVFSMILLAGAIILFATRPKV